MMRSLATLIIVMLSLAATAQSGVDWGVSAGVTNYLGDVNPDGLFRTPGAGLSLFSRINLHPRHSLKGSIMAGTLSGDDMMAGNDFQSGRGDSFSGFVGELAGQFEFNFLPYSTQGRRWNYSPYLAAGVGIAFISTDVFTYTPVIPFAFGFKVNFYKNLGLEVEYGFRKTFYDNFDGLIDPVHPDDHPWTHNNDWYTFTGVSLTWKMFNRLAGCPAFDEEKNYRRRR